MTKPARKIDQRRAEVAKSKKAKLPKGVRLASDFKVKRLSWVWPGRIPRGKITLLEGDPGRGKSMITADMAARVTNGLAFPSVDSAIVKRARGIPRGVVMVCAEDDWEDTIVPRLMAAGADLDRIATLLLERDEDGEVLPLTLPRDLDRIKAAAEAVNALLVIVDPLTAFLGGDVDRA